MSLVPLIVGVDLVVALAALHTAIAPPLGGWAYAYGVGAPVVAVAALVWVGRRLAPIWTFPAALASILVNGGLLSLDEWAAVVLLPLCLGALLGLRALPVLVVEPPVFAGGSAPPSPAVAPLPFTDSDRVPEAGVVSIPLVSRVKAIALLAFAFVVGLVGAWAVLMGVTSQELGAEGGPSGRITYAAAGTFFLLVGILGVYGMTRVVIEGANLEVDATALRARGTVDFELLWTDVERVGLRVRIVHVPGRAVMSRKRNVWMAIDPVSESVLARDDIPWLRPRGADSPAPGSFSAELTVADPYYREPSPTVVALDDALRRMVPGKYVGIIRD